VNINTVIYFEVLPSSYAGNCKLEGEEKRSTENGPEQGSQERLEDVVHSECSSTCKDGKQRGGGVVDSMLESLVVPLRENMEDGVERGSHKISRWR